MAKLPTIKRPDAKFYRGWTFVLVLGLLLAVIALINRGDLDQVRSDGPTPCQFEVVVDGLNIRLGPSADAQSDGTFDAGETIDATVDVTGGFRKLADGRWVSERGVDGAAYLTPVPGSTCV